MSQRSFGSEIGNTTDTMTASNSSADVSLVKHTKPQKQAGDQMEKEVENGKSILRLPKPLAVEVYSKIHNSTLSKDDLLDEIEDLIDEKYYIGETLISAGKEYEVVSSERKGGLTIYTMADGTKIGHRDLRRKKGLSIDEIKQIAMEDVEMIDKVWKVKEDLLKECPIRETKKFAPIFSSANRRASGVSASPATSSTPKKKEENSDQEDSDSDIEEITEDGGAATEEQQNGTPQRRASGRVTGGPAGSTSRRIMEKKKEKERLEKERMEKKEKEKEEKLRKKEEEKAKKQKEKEEKLKEKEEKQAKKAEKAERKSNGAASGSMDKFVKKENGTSNGEAASIFSPSRWGEKRTAIGVKKVDDAWKKRDLEAFNEACSWCEKNLSNNQRNSLENPTYKFAIQRSIDRTKDRQIMKGMKWTKKAEYKAEQAEKRKAQYSKFEPIIKAWFSEDIALDDLLVTSEHLDISTHSKRMDCDEELLKCMEIAQYFVSMRKILLWNENISAEQLRADLHKGLEGFKSSTYKMIANLLETALQEKEYEKAAHCNARLSEFPITEHTITELVRAFFIGNDQMSYKRDSNKRPGAGGAGVYEDDDQEEEMESEEKPIEPEEEPGNSEEPQQQDENDPEGFDAENDEEVAQKVRILALFSDPTHIYEWPAHAQIELLYALKEVVHGLPIIREWYLRDANSEQLTGLKQEANKITKKIEKAQQELADLPTGEITEDMSRQQTREMERVQRKRQQLEQTLDELKDEMEENREAAARERDDLERIFRVVSIGNDRHLRKYYWFAYSSDAGIWVQDFGTTSYEKWVRDCSEKGFMDVETLEVEDRPEYEDLPITSTQSTEIWYKLDTEAAIRHLLTILKKNGKREKQLKKYISNNLDDILASISKQKEKEEANAAKAKAAKKEEEEENGVGQDAEPKEEKEDVESASSTQEDKEMEAPPVADRFTGPFNHLKSTMMELLADWQLSGITKIVDTQQFENKLIEANGLEEMKVLVIELASSIPESCLIEKFPQNIAIAKKCFSHLKMNRFRNRVNEATNSSCLHLLLAYFDARIDQQKTITEMPCQVCRRKQGNRKLMCKQCGAVYHIQCHRPTISRDLFEEEGFKEGWWCAKCTKEDRRRQLAEAKEKREQEQLENGGSDGSGGESDQEDEEMMMMEEEESTSRGRSAKRKANAAMRDVLEFEGVLRHTPAPPPPKRPKKTVLPEVQELFNTIERANPRLYKMLQQIPSQSRSTRNSHHETRSLPEIEDDLDVFQSADQLHGHLTQFFQQARGYVETHNPRKLEELESLISELNFI
ncbi:unnamed protein product [Caenorhabditis brenneri]